MTTRSPTLPSRRRWLQRGATLAATATAPGVLGALSVGFATSAQAAPAEQAWTSSFDPYAAPAFNGELRADRLPVQGRLPAALRGTLFRNGPARLQRGQQHLAHWFDGDGMLQALRFDGEGGLHHHGRLIDTPKSRAEAAAGRFLFGGFGSTVADPAPVDKADAMNPANINVLPMAGHRLYALWEAGSATAIDPHTLATLGEQVWSPETRHAPFGAHPRVAADGTVWNFGYMAGSGKVIVYQIDPSGQLQRQAVLPMAQADMVHDFAITARHLVFLLSPFRFDRGQQPLPNLKAGLHWMADAPMRVVVVDMADFSHFSTELPHGGVFHLGNAWQQGGLIHLGYVRHTQMDRLIQSQRVYANDGPAPRRPALPPSHWCQVQIDPVARRARQVLTDWRDVEFPRWDARRTGQPTRWTVLLHRSGQAHPEVSGLNQVMTLRSDGDAAQAQHFDYGAGWIAEEHVLVPEPSRSGEAEGWIVGTAYHWPSERTTVSVFRADRLADGPLAQARLPYGLPLGLHGQFVAA